MKLPDGKTCSDCKIFTRCKSFSGIKGNETSCEWSPSQFCFFDRKEAINHYLNKLKYIGAKISKQDNKSTKDPIVIVYKKNRIPTTSDYSSDYMYIDHDNCESIDPDIKSLCDYLSLFDCINKEDLEETDCVEHLKKHVCLEKLYYIEVNEFISCFYTVKAAEEYLNRNRHNFKNSHIYIESLNRYSGNSEMKNIREFLITLSGIEENLSLK